MSASVISVLCESQSLGSDENGDGDARVGCVSVVGLL